MNQQRNQYQQNALIQANQRSGAPSAQTRNNNLGNNLYQQGGNAQTQQQKVPTNRIPQNIEESNVEIQYEQPIKKPNQFQQNDKAKQNSAFQYQFAPVAQNTEVNNGKQSNPNLAKIEEAQNNQRQNIHQSQNSTISNQSGQIPPKGNNPFRAGSLKPKTKPETTSQTTQPTTDPYQMQNKVVPNAQFNVNKNGINNNFNRPSSKQEVNAVATPNSNTQNRQNNFQPLTPQQGNTINDNQFDQETSKINNRNIADFKSPNRITTVPYYANQKAPVFSSNISSNQQPSSLKEQQQIQGNPYLTSKVTSLTSGLYPQVVQDTTPTQCQQKTDFTTPQSFQQSSPRFNEVKQEKNQIQTHLYAQGQIGNNNSQALNGLVAPSHVYETPTPTPSRLIQYQPDLQPNVERREIEEFFIVYEDETPTKAEQNELNEQITPKSSGNVYTNIVYSNKLQSALEDLLKNSEKKVSYNRLRQQQEESKENAEQLQERNNLSIMQEESRRAMEQLSEKEIKFNQSLNQISEIHSTVITRESKDILYKVIRSIQQIDIDEHFNLQKIEIIINKLQQQFYSLLEIDETTVLTKQKYQLPNEILTDLGIDQQSLNREQICKLINKGTICINKDHLKYRFILFLQSAEQSILSDVLDFSRFENDNVTNLLMKSQKDYQIKIYNFNKELLEEIENLGIKKQLNNSNLKTSLENSKKTCITLMKQIFSLYNSFNECKENTPEVHLKQLILFKKIELKRDEISECLTSFSNQIKSNLNPISLESKLKETALKQKNEQQSLKIKQNIEDEFMKYLNKADDYCNFLEKGSKESKELFEFLSFQNESHFRNHRSPSILGEKRDSEAQDSIAFDSLFQQITKYICLGKYQIDKRVYPTNPLRILGCDAALKLFKSHLKRLTMRVKFELVQIGEREVLLLFLYLAIEIEELLQNKLNLIEVESKKYERLFDSQYFSSKCEISFVKLNQEFDQESLKEESVYIEVDGNLKSIRMTYKPKLFQNCFEAEFDKESSDQAQSMIYLLLSQNPLIRGRRIIVLYLLSLDYKQKKGQNFVEFYNQAKQFYEQTQEILEIEKQLEGVLNKADPQQYVQVKSSAEEEGTFQNAKILRWIGRESGGSIIQKICFLNRDQQLQKTVYITQLYPQQIEQIKKSDNEFYLCSPWNEIYILFQQFLSSSQSYTIYFFDSFLSIFEKGRQNSQIIEIKERFLEKLIDQMKQFCPQNRSKEKNKGHEYRYKTDFFNFQKNQQEKSYYDETQKKFELQKHQQLNTQSSTNNYLNLAGKYGSKSEIKSDQHQVNNPNPQSSKNQFEQIQNYNKYSFLPQNGGNAIQNKESVYSRKFESYEFDKNNNLYTQKQILQLNPTVQLRPDSANSTQLLQQRNLTGTIQVKNIYKDKYGRTIFY